MADKRVKKDCSWALHNQNKKEVDRSWHGLLFDCKRGCAIRFMNCWEWKQK